MGGIVGVFWVGKGKNEVYLVSVFWFGWIWGLFFGSCGNFLDLCYFSLFVFKI